MRNATHLRPVLKKARSPLELEKWRSYRAKWLSELDPAGHIHRLFDCLPGIFFFAKDREGQLLLASKELLKRYGMEDDSQIMGFRDHDINPVLMADNYVGDDKRLFEGTVARIEHVELWWDPQGLPEWYLVTKLPVFHVSGECAGVVGVLRALDAADRRLPVFQTVAKAVEIIRREYGGRLHMSDIAVACGQSLRQLQRRFQSAFGITPQEFLLKTRVLAAAKLLEETSLSIVQIAEASGFADPNAMGLHFRKRMGTTPGAYRRRFFPGLSSSAPP